MKFDEIWVDSRSEKGCNFQCKMRFGVRKVTSANGRVRDDEFILGSCSNRPAM